MEPMTQTTEERIAGIRRVMDDYGITQIALSWATGIAQGNISRILRGRPKSATLYRIEVAIDKILSEGGQEKAEQKGESSS